MAGRRSRLPTNPEPIPSPGADPDVPTSTAVITSLLDWASYVLEPSGHAPATHHQLLLQRLDSVAAGDIDRLLVLMPPGSAKSTYASILFPAWWLRRHPTSSIIAASHTANLAEHFGRRVRNLVTEYHSVLGYRLAGDSHAAHRFATSERGEYFATGVHGPVVGRRADLVLIDDPIKNHAEADSALARDHLWNWYRSELITRLKPKGRVVLVMTRWHQDDLGGRLLAGDDDWEVLRLPALAEPDDPLNRAPGEALWPAWEDVAALARKRATVGARIWAAQYQLAPLTDAAGLFPAHHIAISDTPPTTGRCVRAWDLAATAATIGRDPDWTVGIKLTKDHEGHCHVLDIVRLRAGPLEVSETIVATAQLDGRAVAIGLPQDPGQAGKQQVAWLTAQLTGHHVVASVETGAKATRAAPVAAQVEAGRLSILRAPWNAAFLAELQDFPLGRKDDQVDALARAYGMLADAPAASRRVQLPFFSR